MNTGNTLRALQEAELTKEQAFADDYPYGISTCLANDGKHLLCAAGKTGRHWITTNNRWYTHRRSSLSRIYLIYTGTYPCSNKT